MQQSAGCATVQTLGAEMAKLRDDVARIGQSAISAEEGIMTGTKIKMGFFSAPEYVLM